MKRASKTFIKYILSNLFIFILPVVVLFVTFSGVLQARYADEISQNNLSMLEQVRDTFDGQLEQLIRISYLIQNDSGLHPGAIAGDIVKERKASSTLSMYNTISNLPEVIMVYREGTDRIYTNSGALSVDRFFDQQYQYSHHTKEDFFHAIAAKDSAVIWSEDDVTQFGGQARKYITLFFAVQSGNTTPKMRSIYLIPVQPLENMLRMVLEDSGGGILLMDKGGHRIAAFGKDAAVLDRLECGEDTQQFRLKDETYSILSAVSRCMGWTYRLALPRHAMGQQFAYLRNYLLVGLIVLLVLGGAAIYLISIHHYKPLMKLKQTALPYSELPPEADEISQVENALSQLSEKRDLYLNTLQENRETFLQEYLTRWLRGQITNEQQFLNDMREIGVDIDVYGMCRVVSLYSKKPAADCLRSALRASSFGLENSLLYRLKEGEGILTLLIPEISEDDDVLLPLQDYLQQTLGVGVAIGVSLMCTFEQVPAGYKQSIKALEMRLLRGDSCVVYYDADMEKPIPLNYPQREMEDLQLSLLQLDENRTKQAIEHILHDIVQKNTPFSVAQMICYDIINTIIRCLYVLSDDDKTLNVPSSEALEQLLSFSTVEELKSALEALVETTCRSMASIRREHEDSRIRKIENYIQENCFDVNFSGYTVADHFGITPSNLAHFFKNATGQSISDRVSSLRKNEACRLLCTTDLTVAQIGEKIGMMNVSSFIRSFKQQTGMTPGQYRENYGRKA